MICPASSCWGQPQLNADWPFYMAFEDATGATDTLWMLLDSASTYPWEIPGIYGETPIEPDTVDFQVWINHPLALQSGDIYNTYIKTMEHDNIGRPIYATNYEYPITVRWDTSLFTADILYETGDPVNDAYIDNEYFFLNNNGWGSVYEMTLDNQAEMPAFFWGSQEHFPIFVSLSRGPLDEDLGIDGVEEDGFSIYPNPASDYIKLSFPKVVTADVRIFNARGKLVLSTTIAGSQKQLNLGSLSSGLYFIELSDEDGRLVKKIVVDR
jgi:hypothetical protein